MQLRHALKIFSYVLVNFFLLKQQKYRNELFTRYVLTRPYILFGPPGTDMKKGRDKMMILEYNRIFTKIRSSLKPG